MAIPDESYGGKAALLLTAAGSSRRFCSGNEGRAEKKEYLPLGGEPVLFRSLLPFLYFPVIGPVIITVPAGDEESSRKLLYSCDTFPALLGRRPLRIVPGGKSRQESVLSGLEALYQEAPETELVLIHDGARPWVTHRIIQAVIDAARIFGSAVPVEPSTSAMKELDDSGMILRHLPRGTTVAAQTPQTFAFPDILQAHRAVKGKGGTYIDDGEVFSAYGRQVKSVPGDPENRKITYRSDLV